MLQKDRSHVTTCKNFLILISLKSSVSLKCLGVTRWQLSFNLCQMWWAEVAEWGSGEKKISDPWGTFLKRNSSVLMFFIAEEHIYEEKQECCWLWVKMWLWEGVKLKKYRSQFITFTFPFHEGMWEEASTCE